MGISKRPGFLSAFELLLQVVVDIAGLLLFCQVSPENRSEFGFSRLIQLEVLERVGVTLLQFGLRIARRAERQQEHSREQGNQESFHLRLVLCC